MRAKNDELSGGATDSPVTSPAASVVAAEAVVMITNMAEKAVMSSRGVIDWSDKSRLKMSLQQLLREVIENKTALVSTLELELTKVRVEASEKGVQLL